MHLFSRGLPNLIGTYDMQQTDVCQYVCMYLFARESSDTYILIVESKHYHQNFSKGDMYISTQILT